MLAAYFFVGFLLLLGSIIGLRIYTTKHGSRIDGEEGGILAVIGLILWLGWPIFLLGTVLFGIVWFVLKFVNGGIKT